MQAFGDFLLRTVNHPKQVGGLPITQDGHGLLHTTAALAVLSIKKVSIMTLGSKNQNVQS